MGNRYLERAEVVFPPPVPEMEQRPLTDLQLVSVEADGSRIYRPATNLSNPLLQGARAEYKDGIFKRFTKISYEDDSSFTIPLLPDRYVIKAPQIIRKRLM